MGRTFQAVRFPGDESVEQARPVFTPATVGQASSQLVETPDAVVRQFEEVQREMDVLRGELNVLRRRDETLNFYMRRLDEELRLAARLQQDFLPKTLPQVGKVHFHTLFRPAGYVSGDLYDVMRLDERRIGFYICDAVGHGMPAALLTMFIKHALITKEITPGGYRLLRPSEALGRLNEALIEQNLSQATFATALYGMIDVETLEVTMSCAGHPAPVVMGREGPLRSLPTEGSLLGIFPGETFTDFTTRLTPGDRLIVYTDGVEVSFCENPSVGDTEKWRDELLTRQALPTSDLVTGLSECMDKESGSLEPKDDLTMVIVEVAE
ncbi:MAG: putative phosphatase [Phycisphaerales bacterium]|nr:putative phosphatase [Phycisphaerales bacterium]